MAETETLKARDRGRTELVILAAARDQLAEGGFQAFGVNTVARRAGCDKQLIYRYYGGLEGLVDAIGRDLANWVDDSLKSVGRVPPQSYCELTHQLLLAFIEALRANVLVQKIAAWEIAEPSPLVARLAAARSMALASWIARQRGALDPPAGVDAPAINAFLIAAAQHLVLSATSSGAFAGVALQTESDWSRITKVIAKMIDDAYAQPD